MTSVAQILIDCDCSPVNPTKTFPTKTRRLTKPRIKKDHHVALFPELAMEDSDPSDQEDIIHNDIYAFQKRIRLTQRELSVFNECAKKSEFSVDFFVDGFCWFALKYHILEDNEKIIQKMFDKRFSSEYRSYDSPLEKATHEAFNWMYTMSDVYRAELILGC